MFNKSSFGNFISQKNFRFFFPPYLHQNFLFNPKLFYCIVSFIFVTWKLLYFFFLSIYSSFNFVKHLKIIYIKNTNLTSIWANSMLAENVLKKFLLLLALHHILEIWQILVGKKEIEDLLFPFLCRFSFFFKLLHCIICHEH